MHVTDGPTFDLIILGGGPSGSVAGIAAARLGAKVLIVEQQGFLGGSLTAMGVGPMMSFHNSAGDQVVYGIAQEIVDRLQAAGASPGHIPDSITYCSTVTPFDAEALKVVLETLLTEAGGNTLFHAQLAHVDHRDGRIDSVVVCTEAGLLRLPARQFIDASGNAVLAWMSGTDCWVGRHGDGATQPMTMKLKVGNVDIAKVRAYIEAHPDDFIFKEGAEEGLRRLRRTPRVSAAGFLQAWAAARAGGEVTVPRSDVLFFETATPGVVIANTSRIQGLDATDPAELSRAEMLGRRQAAEIFRFLRAHCAGFEDAINLGTPSHIGVRETRHVRAEYVIEAEDVLNERQFPDPIALGGYPIDIHSPEGEHTDSQHLRRHATYQIPMRALIATRPANLTLVGRHIGATHEAAAAFRVTPIVMAIGQGGGALAALAIARDCDPRNLDYEPVAAALRAQGAMLEPDAREPQT